MLLSKMRVRLPVIATPYFVHNRLPWITEKWPKAVDHGLDTRLLGDYVAHSCLRWVKIPSQLTMFAEVPWAYQCIDVGADGHQWSPMVRIGATCNILKDPRQVEETIDVYLYTYSIDIEL